MSFNKPIKRPTFNKKNENAQLPSSIVLEKETKLMEEKLRKLKQAMSFESEKTNSTKERWKNSKDQPQNKKTYSQVVEEVRTTSKTENRNSIPNKSTEYEIKSIKSNNFGRAIEGELTIKNDKLSGNFHLVADRNINIALAMQKTSFENKNLFFLCSKVDGHKDVSAFLEKIGLKQYFQIFIENGFDDIEIIKDITVEELNFMRITANNQEKIMNALQKKNIIQKKSDFCQPGNEFSSIKNISKKKNTEVEFDEKKSHESFLEALMEFRNSKKNDNQTLEKKTIFKEKEKLAEIHENDEYYGNLQNSQLKINSKNEPDSKKYKKIEEYKLNKINNIESTIANQQKPFSLFSLNQGEWTNIEPLNVNEKGVGTEKNVEKFSCWGCLKIFKTFIYKQIGNRSFCGEQCLENFKRNNQIRCNGCLKTCLKFEGIFHFDLFYCCKDCYIYKKVEEFREVESEIYCEEIDLTIDKKEIPSLDRLFNK